MQSNYSISDIVEFIDDHNSNNASDTKTYFVISKVSNGFKSRCLNLFSGNGFAPYVYSGIVFSYCADVPEGYSPIKVLDRISDITSNHFGRKERSYAMISKLAPYLRKDLARLN